MIKKTFTIKHILYWLAGGVAVLFRFTKLGGYSLLEFEAEWALNALAVSRDQVVTIGTHPLYAVISGSFFRYFGSSDAMARLLPAMMGVGLIWLVYLLRNRLGDFAALVLAFAFAIDPLFVAASRTVGSPMIAVGLLLALLVAWDRKQIALAGIVFGLFVLAGPSAWMGILIAVLTVVVADLFGWQDINFDRKNVMKVGAFAIGTVIFIGTNFLRFPGGISSVGAGAVAFFGQWVTNHGDSILHISSALLTYQPLAVVIALIAIVRALKQADLRTPVLWLSLTLLVLVSYGGRTVLDLVWLLLPIWLLAAKEISRHLEYFDIHNSVMWSVAGLTTVFIAFIWIDLSGINALSLAVEDLRIRLWIAGAVIILTLLSAVLIGIGWSTRSAFTGLLWGFVIAFGVYTLGVSWTATHVDRRMVAESWLPSPAIPLSNVFIAWMEESSELFIGHENGIDIVALVDSQAMAWALRDFTEAKFASQLAPGEEPSVVIVYENDDSVELQDIYRGQSFDWETQPVDVGFDPVSFFRWLIERDVPTEAERMIMWVRQDVFADGLFFNH